ARRPFDAAPIRRRLAPLGQSVLARPGGALRRHWAPATTLGANPFIGAKNVAWRGISHPLRDSHHPWTRVGGHAGSVTGMVERLIVHAESVVHLHRTLGQVRSLSVAAAVALNPATPAIAVAHVLDLVDMVLVMTVNPGFGGQDYIATMEPKIAEIRAMIDARR